jgi:hypothetical protein
VTGAADGRQIEEMARPFLLFRRDPNIHITTAFDHHVDHAGMAANGAIFNVFLFWPIRKIDRNHDFLTAGWANVNAFVLHDLSSVFPIAMAG